MNDSLQLPRRNKKRNVLKVFKCVCVFPELIKTSTAILCLYGYLSKNYVFVSIFIINMKMQSKLHYIAHMVVHF